MKEVGLLKKLLIFIFLICTSLVSASVEEINLELTRSTYGQEQQFEGSVVIETDSGDLFSVHDKIKTRFDSCEGVASNTEYHSLYDVLTSAGLFSGTEYVYTLGDYTSSISYDESSDTDIYAFSTESAVTSVDFDLTGEGKSLLLDVGVDGDYDWSFLGERINWSSFFYPSGFEGTEYSSNIATVDYAVESSGACNDITVEFDELLSELDLQLFSTVKRVGGGADLELVVDGGASCVPTVDAYDYEEVSCTLSLDVSNLGDSAEFTICLGTTDWASFNFEVPRTSVGEYYFIKAKTGIYNDTLPSETILIGGESLKNQLNNYRWESGCGSGNCLIPFRIYLEEGSVLLDNLDLKYGGITDSNFWEMAQTSSEVEIGGLSLSLSNFEELVTPSEETDECFLEVEFEGEEDLEFFTVGAAPIAVISVDYEYFVEGDNIQFDSSLSNSSVGTTLESYFWSFGDGANSTLASPVHSYNTTGNFTVSLIVTDSQGVSDSDSVVVHVADLEDYLDSRFVEVGNDLDDSFSFFSNMGEDLSSVYVILDFESVLASTNNSISDLEIQFIEAKNNQNLTETEKNIFYGTIATELNDLSKLAPTSVYFKDSLSMENMLINSPSNIFPYSGTSSLSFEEFSSYKNALYDFNQVNVDIGAEFDLFDVIYLEGNETYLLVSKRVNVTGGNNNVLVENLKDQNINEVYSDGIVDSSFMMAYWSMFDSKEISYIVKSDSLDLIQTVVFSDIPYEIQEILYEYDCLSGDCDFRYCGDGYCTTLGDLGVNEGDENNQYYCDIDCKRAPIYIWIILGVILILGIFYINFYRGPGNFQAVANKITFTLFRRKLFVTDRDRIVLTNYVSNALKRGFHKEQIKTALVKKGWNNKQLDTIFRNI